MPFFIPVVLPILATGARLLWSASKFGVVAVAKNPIKTGIVGMVATSDDPIGVVTDTFNAVDNGIDTVSDNMNYLTGGAMVVSSIYLFKKLKNK